MGLGYMVKDFCFAFRNSLATGATSASAISRMQFFPTAQPTTTCISCHVRLASDTDYVIAKAHLGLDRSVR